MSTRSNEDCQRIRIFLVDDHPIVREGLSALIAQESDMEVCGEADSVIDAVRLVRDRRPDVMVIDISLKDGSGLDLIKRVRALDESLPMIASSMHDEKLYAERVIRAGAMGYVTKQVASRHVIDAIRTVLGGKVYLSEEMSQRLLQNSMGKKPRDQSPVETLSDRELTVFELIGQGFTTKKIAQHLHLSVKTIETYREKIKEKLSLADAAELSLHATQWVIENR